MIERGITVLRGADPGAATCSAPAFWFPNMMMNYKYLFFFKLFCESLHVIAEEKQFDFPIFLRL